jgi:hypothetical protein
MWVSVWVQVTAIPYRRELHEVEAMLREIILTAQDAVIGVPSKGRIPPESLRYSCATKLHV